MACYIVPDINPVLFRPNRKFIGRHHCVCPKLLKTRVRVPLSSAISNGGVTYNSLVSEVRQIYIFFLFQLVSIMYELLNVLS